MTFEGEIKVAKMSSFSSDYQTLIKHIFPLYFLFELLLFNEFENSICKFMLFFQFCNHLFSVDSRIEERKLRFKAETLHGTKRKGGESLWSGSANLLPFRGRGKDWTGVVLKSIMGFFTEARRENNRPYHSFQIFFLFIGRELTT